MPETLPLSSGREEMLELEQLYDVATGMWQALSEAKAELDVLIDRIEAADFPELAAAAAG